MKKAVIIATLLSGLPAGAIAVAAPPNLPFVPEHRHFIQDKNGTLVAEVGPRWCDDLDNEKLEINFRRFHFNVHRGAPGLDNDKGSEIVARGCSFGQ